jgi:hypothetical protein
MQAQRDRSPKRRHMQKAIFCDGCCLMTADNVEEFINRAITLSIPALPNIFGQNSDIHKAVLQKSVHPTALEWIRNKDRLAEQIKAELVPEFRRSLYSCLSNKEREQLPIQFLNDGMFFREGLEFDEMDQLPLRQVLLAAQWARQLVWNTRQDSWVSRLHPRRRHLWHLNEHYFMWLGHESAVLCTHCDALIIQLGIDSYSVPVDGDFTDYFYNPAFTEIMEAEANVIKLLDYAGREVFADDLIDQTDEFGDDPHYHPVLAYQPFPLTTGTVCWRFFKTKCQRCSYEVAAAPAASKEHCLACYYFRHVLNELLASLTKRDCPAACLSLSFNQARQWPLWEINV